MSKQIGFGVIGCGVIAPYHIQGINLARGARLAAVSDTVGEKAQKLGEKYGVDWYDDCTKLLARNDVNAVCICTPSSLHAEQAIAAARAGKHVLTEKPMAVTLKDADAMINACRKNKVKLGVIFQRRTWELFQEIRKAVRSGELGRIVLGDCVMKYYRSQEYYNSAGWRGTWKYDGGGALMNQGIHMIDMLQWIMGPVDSVCGHALTLARKIEVEDTCTAVVRFRSGATGVIEGTTSVFPDAGDRLEIHGEKGSIMVKNSKVAVWAVEGKGGKLLDRTSQKAERFERIMKEKSADYSSHRRQVQDMVNAINRKREPMITGEEGRKAIEIILAIYKSSKTGRPVKLPLHGN